MSWARAHDHWTQSDIILENFLAACVRFRRDEVLSEAFMPREPKPLPVVEPQPRPKRVRPSAPTPDHPSTRHIPTTTDRFTDQQMTKGAEILARINQRKTA